MKSSHYRMRLQQRAFPADAEVVCVKYGREIYQGKGRIAYAIGEKEVHRHPFLADYSGCSVVIGP